MFILVADEVYNHFWSLIFWWPLKLHSTHEIILWHKRQRFLFNVYKRFLFLTRFCTFFNVFFKILTSTFFYIYAVNDSAAIQSFIRSVTQKQQPINMRRNLTNCLKSTKYDHVSRSDCRTTVIARHEVLTLDPTNDTDYCGSPYPLGMDPVRIECYCIN